MSDKLVWSNNATLNSLLALSEDDLKAELIDYGYSEDFIGDSTLDELHNILYEEETLWEMDVDDFENNIVPMINKQTCDGIVLMVGDVARWDGKHSAGKAVFTEDLKGGDIDPDVVDVDIYDDGDGLVWLGHHHDGTHKFKLYALPENNQVDFIRDCMDDAIQDEYNWYHDGEDFDDVEDDILETILGNFTDLDYLTSTINFGQVPNYCKPIKNLLNESFEEDCQDDESLNEASTKEPKKLKKEIKEIKGLVDNYGLKYITSMPFTSFDNDPTSIEYNYPEFFKIVKSFYKEMELASKEDLANNDLLDEYWDVDFDNYDYDVVMRVCDKLVSRPGVPVQIEKIYKTGYNSPLDDEDILADRERQDELAAQYGESLNETRYDLLDKKGYPIGSYTNRDKAIKAAKEKENELGGVEIHDNGSVKKYDKKYTGWLKQNESLNEEKKTADDLYEFANSLSDVDSSETIWMFKSEDDLDNVLKLMHDNGVYPDYGYEVFKAYDSYYEGWISIDDFENKVDESLNEEFKPNSTFHFDNSISWDEFYDEDFIEKMKEHDGKPCHASVTVWVDGKEDPASNYFTATFEDGFELKDISGYHLDLDEVEIEESLNEDSDYIVVRGVKVPKEYFEKYPGLTNFEVRDKFLADEEEESPYMHADDIEFDEALVEGVKIPKTWLVTDKLDQQFKVRNGNHFYTEEDVKDYYPDVTKVEVIEYFTEDELNEKPWMVDNFNDHKRLKESWDYAMDYAKYAWDNPRVDIIKMLKDDGKDKKFIDDVLNLLDEFAAEDELNRLND